MIHKTGSKHVGSSSILTVKTLFCNVERLLAFFFNCSSYLLLFLSFVLLRVAKGACGGEAVLCIVKHHARNDV